MAAMTNAERQRKYRANRKAKGIKTLQVPLTQEQEATLRQCYDMANDPGDSFEEFLVRVLLRGAAFTANAGRGKGKVKRVSSDTRQRYTVTN